MKREAKPSQNSRELDSNLTATHYNQAQVDLTRSWRRLTVLCASTDSNGADAADSTEEQPEEQQPPAGQPAKRRVGRPARNANASESNAKEVERYHRREMNPLQ